MGLTTSEIQALLQKELRKEPAKPRLQKGPLRFYDKTLRCANRGCGSPTYIKVEGIQRCMKHALQALNDLCIEMLEVIENRAPGLITKPNWNLEVQDNVGSDAH